MQFPIYDAYMEARSDPSLDARDLESLDLEAREYLEYLEAREAATCHEPKLFQVQTPANSTIFSGTSQNNYVIVLDHSRPTSEHPFKAYVSPYTSPHIPGLHIIILTSATLTPTKYP